MNQLMKRNFAALMHRTAHRPLAAGRIRSSSALAFGLALLAGGAVELAMADNSISAAIALATVAVYLFI
jgi:protoheme IX farnesyltransferase